MPEADETGSATAASPVSAPSMGISTLEETAGDWHANSVSIGASSLSAAVGRSGGGETGVMALAWVLGASTAGDRTGAVVTSAVLSVG